MWFHHPHFLPLLKKWWISAPFAPGSKIHQFSNKLKHVKEPVKIWNIQVFKNVFKQKEIVKLQLEESHCSIIKIGMENDTYVKKKELQVEWVELCNKEEDYW